MPTAAQTLNAERIRDVNARYHDVAAETYDCKWGIDYGEVGSQQVMMKLRKALGNESLRFERGLEIGAGTGYFTLNLLRQRVIGEATATDISRGMLERLGATARSLGLSVTTVRCNAEELPFDDESFDIVYGHAVLHHLPHPEAAMAEFGRVLVPGGTLAFMGEPSYAGDRLAAIPKRLGSLAAPVWRRAVGARPTSAKCEASTEDHELERQVDVHTFSPGDLRELAQGAGLEDLRVRGEELLASIHGWTLRSLEAGTEVVSVPRAWHLLAYRSYLALQHLDRSLLEPRLPAGFFYNLLLSARKPG
jgi:ubiquinone/menaquinone biosynthesis C-methylase UbiE